MPTQRIENKVLDFNGVEPGMVELDDVKQYGLVSKVRYPVAVRVDLVVDKEVAKQNPRLAVDVRNVWRSFYESDRYSDYSDGAQTIEDYRRTLGEYSPSYRYVGNPSLIKPGSFDNDGLHLAGDVAITKATGDWSHIGRDVSPGFNYVDTFNLHRNVAVRYIAPEYEDLADIAVVEYVPSTEASSTLPDGTDTGVDSSQAGGAKAKQRKVLPATGEQVSVWLVALGLLILVVAVFIYRRKKSDKRFDLNGPKAR
ncbi:LPXTG cell wall anchor domain-containing protein [Streptococcus cuniculi]|nr:LPXTG cell wall anchor domain-containing protein [Streptococcus cuniculi]